MMKTKRANLANVFRAVNGIEILHISEEVQKKHDELIERFTTERDYCINYIYMHTGCSYEVAVGIYEALDRASVTKEVKTRFMEYIETDECNFNNCLVKVETGSIFLVLSVVKRSSIINNDKCTMTLYQFRQNLESERVFNNYPFEVFMDSIFVYA